jgi:hypothetical protein
MQMPTSSASGGQPTSLPGLMKNRGKINPLHTVGMLKNFPYLVVKAGIVLLRKPSLLLICVLNSAVV